MAPWEVGSPLLEDHYNFEDALLLGCMMITLLKHADRVKIACLAQLVNVIAPIMTEEDGEAWRQTIFYPFAQVSNYGRGQVIRPVIESGSYKTSDFAEVPYLESIAVHNIQAQEVVIFAVNRGEESLDFTMNLEGYDITKIKEFSQMAGFDIKEVNNEKEERVKPEASESIRLEGQTITADLEPLSWNMIRVAVK